MRGYAAQSADWGTGSCRRRPGRAARRDELGALAEDLHAVGARLAEKERLRHADRLRTIGQLAAGIAHELGTPLSVVRLRAGMIASGDATADEAKDNGRIIVEQVDRVSGLVRQLLDYSRRQGGQATLVDLRPLVAMSLDMLRPLAERAGVSLVWSRPAEPTVVRADAIQLQQVVTNLVMNGVQAMTSGGTVRVEVGRGARGAPGVTLWASEEVWLRVEDDGPGIPPEHLPHVFEPFYTTKPVGEGTGLGLAVVQAIVEEHGGRVDVESDPGVGTRFTVLSGGSTRGGATGVVTGRVLWSTTSAPCARRSRPSSPNVASRWSGARPHRTPSISCGTRTSTSS